MTKRFSRNSSKAFSLTVGWLFADLLLALGMLFLISSPPQPKPMPTPTPLPPTITVAPTPTPTPDNRILEHNYCRIKLNIGSPVTFINDDVGAARSIVESQLNQIAFLRGRQVGIAIAYGGTIGGSEEQGTEIATQVYNVLRALAKDKQAHVYTVFRASSLYESLFTGLETFNTAIINVYLVVRPGNPNETCNTQNQVIS